MPEGNKHTPTVRTKVIRAETQVIEKGRVQAVVSTEAKDRDGDIIRQEHWNLDNFLAHPVLLSSHDYRNLRSQIGEWEDMGIKGKKLVGVAKYYIGEGNEEADWGYNLAEKGRAAYSVGFKPDMDKAVSLDESDRFFGGYEFNGQELLEVSHVTIPSNPQALQSIKTVKLHPAVAEIVDEVLREQQPPTLTLSTADSNLILQSPFIVPPTVTDWETALIEKVVKRLKAEIPEMLKGIIPPAESRRAESLEDVISRIISEEVVRQ